MTQPIRDFAPRIAFALAVALLLIGLLLQSINTVIAAGILMIVIGITLYATRHAAVTAEKTILALLGDSYGWRDYELVRAAPDTLDMQTIHVHLQHLGELGMICVRAHTDPPTGLPWTEPRGDHCIYFLPSSRLPGAARKVTP